MTTLLYHHPVCAQHLTGTGHPESPARLAAILKALQAPEFGALIWREAPAASRAQLMRVHSRAHVDTILAAAPKEGLRFIDADTLMSPRSGEAALHAAGAVCAAVDAVLAGEASSAFCAVRPPGHHAEPNEAMGFCLFNNVAVGAFHARAQHGLKRVTVIDFDVHHGNGTQAAFWSEPECLYISTHQSPLYPGTGRRDERGVAGNILNVPFAPYSGARELRAAWDGEILPKLRDFKPELILLSAGFDAHAMDPLASLNFKEDDYAWMTQKILEIAADCCAGRVVSSLEGGYDLDALAASAAAHVQTLLAGPRP